MVLFVSVNLTGRKGRIYYTLIGLYYTLVVWSRTFSSFTQ